MAYETHRSCEESSQTSIFYHVKEQQAERLTNRKISLSIKSPGIQIQTNALSSISC